MVPAMNQPAPSVPPETQVAAHRLARVWLVRCELCGESSTTLRRARTAITSLSQSLRSVGQARFVQTDPARHYSGGILRIPSTHNQLQRPMLAPSHGRGSSFLERGLSHPAARTYGSCRDFAAGRAAARGRPPAERKVRAPQDGVVGNTHRPQGSGKCNRKQTASSGSWSTGPEAVRGKGETVR